MKNREIAERIAELHYPNEPNVIHDQKYRLVRMKALADQVERELNLLTIPVVSQAKRPVCHDCFDRGELRNDKEEIIGTCPCHY